MARALARSVVASLLFACALIWAQPALSADNAPAGGNPPVAKQKAKPKGRLPSYYSKVVDGIQRDKIYDVQKKYGPQIEQLQAQLKELTEKRDAEVAALLTPEQRERLATLQAEAKEAAAKKRAAAKTAQPAANSTTSSAASPAAK